MSHNSELQTLFDISYRHIIQQGRGSFRGEGERFMCLYRTEDGRGCGAAPFISSYSSMMEGNRFPVVVDKFEDSIDPLAVKHVHFVTELQDAHDRAAASGKIAAVSGRAPGRAPESFMEQYKKNMSDLAERFDLTIPEVV